MKFLTKKNVTVSEISWDLNVNEEECIVLFFGKDSDEYELEISEREAVLFINNNLEGNRIKLKSVPKFLNQMWNE